MKAELQANAIKNYYQRVYGLIRPPAAEQQIIEVETTLGFRLPPALRALYLLCDGIDYPGGDSPLFWVQMIPRQTEEFREFSSHLGSKRYMCFGYSEGLRYLGIEIDGEGKVVSFDPGLDHSFQDLGPDLLTAYKNLEKFHREAIQEKPLPEEYWK